MLENCTNLEPVDTHDDRANHEYFDDQNTVELVRVVVRSAFYVDGQQRNEVASKHLDDDDE